MQAIRPQALPTGAGMSFSADWLALRAPADDRARDPGLVRTLSTVLAGRTSVRVLDLGSGTGASLHALTDHLGAAQHWTLVDHDPALLEHVEPPAGITVARQARDLRTGIADLLAEQPDLVTASAFFDLAGSAWIEQLVRDVCRAGAIFYTALTYDGRETWSPASPHDAAVHDAFLSDQRKDKGLGPAAGPEATLCLSAAFRKHGYDVRQATSDWVLECGRDDPLIGALKAGTAAAVSPKIGPVARAWENQHRTQIRIGHQDLLALPGPTS